MSGLGEEWLTPAEVAQIFRVNPGTVIRWTKAGKLNAIRTPGGHRRYRTSEVRALLGEREPSTRKRAETYLRDNPDGSVTMTREQAGGGEGR